MRSFVFCAAHCLGLGDCHWYSSVWPLCLLGGSTFGLGLPKCRSAVLLVM